MLDAHKINLKFQLTDGTTQTVSFTIPAAKDGADGKDGDNGKDGVGIVSISVTQEDLAFN